MLTIIYLITGRKSSRDFIVEKSLVEIPRQKKNDFSMWPNRFEKIPSETGVQPASNVITPVGIGYALVEKSSVGVSQVQKNARFSTWPNRYEKSPSETAVQPATNVIILVGIDSVIVEKSPVEISRHGEPVVPNKEAVCGVAG